MCMYVCQRMYVHHMSNWELKYGPLQEKQALLTTESSPRPLMCAFENQVRVDKMGKWIRTDTSRPDDLNSIPITLMVERRN